VSTVAMSGNDSVVLNNRIFTDMADNDFAMLRFPDKIANIKIGKNGNAIYSLNESGKRAEFELRLVRGSADDKFMANLLLQQQNNFPSFPLMFGEFIKLVGDGQGNITNDTYITSGGIFVQQVDAKSNASGDSDQSVSVYKLEFANSPRALT
jgi:hypothetical protein